MPLTLIGEAVFARCLICVERGASGCKQILKGPEAKFKGIERIFRCIRQALYASKIISYAQGFMLMRQASKEYKWKLNYGVLP